MAGSLLRYLITLLALRYWDNVFPFGTLIVNIAGAFLLGLFTSMFIKKDRLNHHLRLGIGTGAIGSFTTLSTLSSETVILIDKHAYITALLYILASIAGGIAAGYAGYRAGDVKKKVKGHV